MKFDLEPAILTWLTSLGYDVFERPKEVVAAMFTGEACQWELAPEELAVLVREGYYMQDGVRYANHGKAQPAQGRRDGSAR